MLIPRLAGWVWGVADLTASYRFAMGYGASLIFGWTVLLLWAYRRPIERRFVALLTALVIVGLVLAEVAAVLSGTLEARRLVLTWCLQALLLALFVGAYYRHLTSALRPYLLSCGLLTIPILVWNIAFTRYLPPPLAPAVFWRDIPRGIVIGENVFRTLVSVLPFFMPLTQDPRRRHEGLAWFGIGVSIYFVSWLLLILLPASHWSTSAVGLLAPAYTPLVWLGALGMLGPRLAVPVYWRPWLYWLLALAFLVFHLTHAALVVGRVG